MTHQTDAPEKNEPINGTDPVPPSPRGRSSIGIASIIIGILNPILFGMYGYFSYRGMPYTLIRILESSLVCVVPVLWIAGLVLAIIGLARKRERKLLPLVGLILNIIYLCPLAFSFFGLFMGM